MTRPDPKAHPRWNLIRRLRKQIAEGTYVTYEKLEAALERALKEDQCDPPSTSPRP